MASNRQRRYQLAQDTLEGRLLRPKTQTLQGLLDECTAENELDEYEAEFDLGEDVWINTTLKQTSKKTMQTCGRRERLVVTKDQEEENGIKNIHKTPRRRPVRQI